MSLLRMLSNSGSSQPLTLRMTLVSEGVKVGIYRDGRALPRSDLIGGTVPAPLLRFLRANANAREYMYMLPWPHAKALYDDLRADLQAHPTETFKLEAGEIEALTQIDRPANFEIRWVYDAARKCLERYLIYADRHLGMGWFQRDTHVWQLTPPLTEVALQWIGVHRIIGTDIYPFVALFMAAAARANWPFSCNLTVQDGLTLRFEMARMLDHSADVRMVSSIPAVLDGLQFIDGDTENLISTNRLIPKLRPAFSDRLLKIAHVPMLRLSDEELAAFIQDDLRPRAALLKADMAAIDARYPIYAADKLGPVWQLEHGVQVGIGQYRAVPYWAASDRRDAPRLPLATLIEALNKDVNRRFYPIGNGWVELTPEFKTHLKMWGGNFGTFELSPQELLGQRSPRWQTTGLKLPPLKLPETFSDPTVFLDALRNQGIPGGFSGLQADAKDVLVNVCQHLLKDNLSAAILWVVPQKKRDGVVESLQTAGIPFENAPGVRIKGRVILTSPGLKVELQPEWTLIILQDLDILAFSESQVHFFSELGRLWTVATFTRPSWSQDAVRQNQIRRALQLAPENMPIFQRQCVKVFPDQHDIDSTPVPSRLLSPFRRIIPDGLDTPSAGMPIPASRRTQPMPLNTKATQVMPVVPSSDAMMPPPGSRSLFTGRQARESFTAQARRFVERSEPSATPMPFNQYFPSYDNMTPAQLRYYFYWRTKLRQGKYLDADLGYLFVHVYEALNLIGFPSAQIAFDHLLQFWLHYRAAQPKLDTYLPDWLADFIVVYKLPRTPLQWYAQVEQWNVPCSDYDLCVEAWMQSKQPISALPNDLLYQMATYWPIKTKFYQANNQDGRLDAAYKKGLQAVDDYLTQQGKSLFETYRPSATRIIRRPPFQNALHDVSPQPITIATVTVWSGAIMLSARLTAIIKSTENVIRKQDNYKAKLQGIELPPEWTAVLERALALPPTRREITLDMSSVDKLRRQSDEIRQRLIVSDETSSAETLSDNATTNNGTKTTVVPPVPPEAPSDTAAVAAVIGAPDGVGMRVLRVLHDHDWQASASVLKQALSGSQLLNIELDYLNERALNQLGDTLVCAESPSEASGKEGSYVVAEDYRDEVAYVLEHPHFAVVPPEPSGDDNQYADLSDEWAAFAREMKPYHWEVLSLLLEGQAPENSDVNARLALIAKNAALTPSRLIDDINSFALDSIGDIVISIDADTPHIETEDAEGLRKLLEWANAKAISVKR